LPFILFAFLLFCGFGKTKTLKFLKKTSAFSRSFAKQMTNKKKKDAGSHASAFPNEGKTGSVFKTVIATIREAICEADGQNFQPIYKVSELKKGET